MTMPQAQEPQQQGLQIEPQHMNTALRNRLKVSEEENLMLSALTEQLIARMRLLEQQLEVAVNRNREESDGAGSPSGPGPDGPRDGRDEPDKPEDGGRVNGQGYGTGQPSPADLARQSRRDRR